MADDPGVTKVVPAHEHWWSEWFPKDRAGHYRQCLRKGCPATEDRKATT